MLCINFDVNTKKSYIPSGELEDILHTGRYIYVGLPGNSYGGDSRCCLCRYCHSERRCPVDQRKTRAPSQSCIEIVSE